MESSHDRLSRTLADWRIARQRNPDFRAAVWARIGRRSDESWTSYMRGHLAGWAAVAGLAVAVAGWAGHAMAREKLDAGRERMVVSYLSELDPRVLAKLEH